ncbi:MAG: biotin synthase BioB [Verrucomicrobiota bacterium]|nr:biotin synthase BioB [Verrucomicrobiota bacterium]
MKRTVTLPEIRSVYHLPLFELIEKARKVYKENWHATEVQLCTLLSIKTGGCSEDCGYCAQSAKNNTGLKAERLLPVEEVLEKATLAKQNGSTRFCMGAAWKGIREDDPRFDEILEMVQGVTGMGLEACVTLGSLTAGGARRLKAAGLDAYNHNIDTSPEYYDKIVTSHTFQDRLNTIKHVQEAGISVCCGGIIGLGESEDHRLQMLQVLTTFEPQPESIPINALVAVEGTPLEKQQPVNSFELIRLIATTRIFFPHAKVRLSAGRTSLSKEAQAMAFYSGANSIFYGDKLLTTPNPDADEDLKLLRELDLLPEAPTPVAAEPLAPV